MSSGKPFIFYFGITGQGHGHKNSAGESHCTLVSAGFFLLTLPSLSEENGCNGIE